MLTLALKLLIAHVIGDFVFQPYKWVVDKLQFKHRSKYLYYHIGVHLLALLLVTRFETDYYIPILVIVITHYFIDLSKLNLDGRYNSGFLFVADQLAHISILMGVAYVYGVYVSAYDPILSDNQLLLVLSVLSIVFVSRILMHLLMGKWSVDYGTSQTIQRIGTFVGISERLLVFAFAVNGHWLYIGILFVLKTILRMYIIKPKDEHVRFELFLLGTFLSFGMAVLIGLGYLHYLS